MYFRSQSQNFWPQGITSHIFQIFYPFGRKENTCPLSWFSPTDIWQGLASTQITTFYRTQATQWERLSLLNKDLPLNMLY